MKFATSRSALVALIASLAIAGCNSIDSDRTGKVSLHLTDAPGDILAAVVTVSSVHLLGDDGAVLVFDDPYTTDLIDLAGTTAVVVQDVEVPNGQYKEIRFVITGGYIEVDNGDGSSSFFASSPDYEGLPAGVINPGNLQMPSFGSSGLKVKLPGNGLLVNFENYIILADFDASASFGHPAGNSGQWVMHPAIKVTVD